MARPDIVDPVIIDIDLGRAHVQLRDPDDFTRFSVATAGSGADLSDVISRSGLGRLAEDGHHVVVDPAGLRSLAGPAATPSWDAGLAAMCAYAAGKGWIEDDGWILAHLESGAGAG